MLCDVTLQTAGVCKSFFALQALILRAIMHRGDVTLDIAGACKSFNFFPFPPGPGFRIFAGAASL